MYRPIPLDYVSKNTGFLRERIGPSDEIACAVKSDRFPQTGAAIAVVGGPAPAHPEGQELPQPAPVPRTGNALLADEILSEFKPGQCFQIHQPLGL